MEGPSDLKLYDSFIKNPIKEKNNNLANTNKIGLKVTNITKETELNSESTSSDSIIEKESNPSIIYNLVHETQKSYWDCGISCIVMILPTNERDFFYSNLDYFSKTAPDSFGTSTWTIDLSYLLAHYKMEHIYYTTCVGVNEELNKEKFYSKCYKRDYERVKKRIENREKNGIRIVKARLEINEILQNLDKQGPIISLINANLLHCITCRGKLHSFWQLCCNKISKEFHGHYIVLVGYDLKEKVIYYRDPGLSSRVCKVSFSLYDKARFSFGTDEDLIVLNKTIR